MKADAIAAEKAAKAAADNKPKFWEAK